MIRWLALLLLLPLQAIAGEAVLTWDAPTQNEDGTPLTDLAGFKIYQADAPGGPYTPVGDVPGTALTFTVESLPDGTYYFVATAYNEAGTESQYSGEVSKVVVTIPSPPQNLAVEADNTVAYMLSISDDAVVMVPVGFVDAGVTCDGTTEFNNHYRVDIDDVNYAGTVRPPVVFAACSGG